MYELFEIAANLAPDRGDSLGFGGSALTVDSDATDTGSPLSFGVGDTLFLNSDDKFSKTE